MTEFPILMPDPAGTPPLTTEQAEAVLAIKFTDGRMIGFLALMCGWTHHSGASFTSPDGTHLRLPIHDRGINIKVLRSHVRKVFRHRAPGTPPVAVLIERAIVHYKIDESRITMLRALANEVGSPVEPVQEVGGTSTEPAPVATPPGHKRKRKITREEPWSAHTSPRDGIAQTYPSDAVMERVWSDNTTDYACRWEDCDYSNESPQSTARHFAAHKRGQGRTPLPEPDGVDPDHAVNSRRHTRINKLRREVDGALTAALAQSIDWSVVDQAEWIATWIIDHRVEPVKGSTDDDEGELTSDQILDRIAALADRGRGKVLREQVDTLSAQADDYLIQLDEAKQQAAAAFAKAGNTEGELLALRDLLNDIVNRNTTPTTPEESA